MWLRLTNGGRESFPEKASLLPSPPTDRGQDSREDRPIFPSSTHRFVVDGETHLLAIATRDADVVCEPGVSDR